MNGQAEPPPVLPPLSMSVYADGCEVYMDEADLRVCWSYVGDGAGDAAFSRFLEVLRFIASHGQDTEHSREE